MRIFIFIFLSEDELFYLQSFEVVVLFCFASILFGFHYFVEDMKEL